MRKSLDSGTSFTELSMIVEWSGPFALLPATLEPNALPEAEGVYLWVLPHHGQRLVHYVGYASNIRYRQYTHIVRTLGGGDWAPRFPIGERVENRYARASSRGARNVEYDRLKQYVAGLPGSAEEILEYFRSVEIFTHLTPNARDLEYLMQQHFMTLTAARDPRSALCIDMSLRESRRIDPAFSIAGHAFPAGVSIGGLSDL